MDRDTCDTFYEKCVPGLLALLCIEMQSVIAFEVSVCPLAQQTFVLFQAWLLMTKEFSLSRAMITKRQEAVP